MNLDEVLALIKAAEETTFDTFELNSEEFSLKLERRNYRFALEREGPAPVFVQGTTAAVAQSVPLSPVAPAPELEAQTQTEVVEDEFMDTKEIRSPLLGVFHQLPDGRTVKAGDKLKKGDVICMVEAMKLMNEILMPEDGEIVWVAVNDNTMVEYDDLLFRYV